ncbi:MAG: VWA domain-containing protein [Ferruginibacter sp.]
MLRFQHIEYLLALAALPVLAGLYFLVLNWKKKTIKKIGDERLVKELIKTYSPKKFALKFILVITAFAAAAFGLANLRSPQGSEKVSRNGIDVMVALDVSKSMLAQDIKPSRLDRAKQLLGKLMDRLNNDRIGIVVFAGKAYLQMPLTGDHGAAKMFLSSASPDVVPTQGTVISDALKMCYTSFNAKEKKYKAVILISDGEDHDEEAASLAARMAAEGVIIHTVGIGSAEGTAIIDPATNEVKKDKEGNTVITKLNETELKTIAEKGNGLYQLYDNTEAVVSNLEAQLNSMDQRTVTEDSLVNYKSYFQYFLLLSLLLLVLEVFVSERKQSGDRKLKPVITAFLLLLSSFFFLLPAAAQNEKAIIKKGNEAYGKGEYENAAAEYKKVTEKNPANATANYNLGNALYKNKKTDEAVTAYENAAGSATAKMDRSKALYNKGVVLQNNNKLPECITAYKDALKLNPQDDDARQNLQKALQQQKKQQEQQKNNKQQQKPKEDEKQKEKEKQKQDEKQQPQPKPKISKKDAEEKLKALLQQEKNLQDKLRKVDVASPDKPEKDW